MNKNKLKKDVKKQMKKLTKRRFSEWLSMQIVKRPGRMVLAGILVFNILFFILSAVIISNMQVKGTEKMNFFRAAFSTVTMILDPGCIQFVIEDIGEAGVAISIVCFVIIIIGMISFTGAVIGYVTNTISNFVESTNTGKRKLKVSDHIVILNWNSRASEIVNDLLYSDGKEKVVVLVGSRKAEIVKEIDERLSDTVVKENRALLEKYKEYGFFKKLTTVFRERFKKSVSVVVREGDVFSSKQLHDISLENARTVVILGADRNNSVCKFEQNAREEIRGNTLTVKTLMQVADITASKFSADNQKIIVEITDDWTEDLVRRIINNKQVDGKCNIVPVRVNKVMGQLLSQFSLMPELNLVYKDLFSNKGATFYAKDLPGETDEDKFRSDYLATHRHAIPLTVMEKDGRFISYFAANNAKDVKKTSSADKDGFRVNLNEDYWIEQKHVIILGHNSKCRDIMRGFISFRNEWNRADSSDEIVQIVVIDDQKNLEKMNFYREYPFVIDTVSADIYDRETICETINKYVSSHEGDTSILILSDDEAPSESIDANALANLIYVQDIITQKEEKMKEEGKTFDRESIDVIVEIIDPKHHDIINNYNSKNNQSSDSSNNVVISNRYISKMIMQIGEKDALYQFYIDILTYDDCYGVGFDSKEIYAKKVTRLFKELPGPCNAEQFIRAVYDASVDPSLPPEKRNPTIALGYVKPGGKMVLFSGDQRDQKVELGPKDKLIVFSNH